MYRVKKGLSILKNRERRKGRLTKKPILATVFCLVLVSVIPITTVAYTPPGGWPSGQPYFTLYAMLSSDLPYATWSGGYHDVMYEIQKELANIGIELEITLYDSWTIWSSCWEEKWNVSSETALPPDGWDITCTDWWTQFPQRSGRSHSVRRSGRLLLVTTSCLG